MEGGKPSVYEMVPKCMAIAHGSCYLRSVHYEGNGGGSFIELGGGGGGAYNPRCRFYLEASKRHYDESLMHVRCCYNNKYWVPRQREQDGWVIGTCDGPEEDLSKPSCTLFKLLIPEHEEHSIRFLHCKLGKLCAAQLPSSDTPTRLYLPVALGEEADAVDAFTFLDLSQQKQLPKYLAFKGVNGMYLRVVGADHDDSLDSMSFTGEDISDPAVLHTSFSNDDGTVRIKSNLVNKFWKLRNYLGAIQPDSNDNTCNDVGTLFEVIDWDTDDEAAGQANFIVLLRNRGNNKICTSVVYPHEGPAVLYAYLSEKDSITQDARLRLEEPVVSRLIYDVRFDRVEARLTSKEEVVEAGIREYSNKTSQQQTAKLTYTDTHTTTATWSNSISLKGGVKTTIKAGIPFVVDGKIEVSAELAYSHTGGGATTETRTQATEYSLVVPPHTRVTVRAVQSKGVWDVPYSYKQRDVLYGGQEVTHEFHDGIFSGVSTNVIRYESTEDKLGCHVTEPPPAEE